MKVSAIGLLLACGLAAAPASAMTVAEFLGKANALKARGMMALFSSDITVLKNEVMVGTKAWRAQAAPPGRPANACPPQGPLKLSSDDILAMMNAVPVPQRPTMSSSDAIVAALNRRYPCKG